MEGFDTNYVFHEIVPEPSLVNVIFRSTAYFHASSQPLPTATGLLEGASLAFQGDSADGYLGMLQALPGSNVFSSTTMVKWTLEEDDGITTETKKDARIVIVSVSGLLFVLASSGFLYRQYSKQGKLAVEGKETVETDSSTGNQTETVSLSILAPTEKRSCDYQPHGNAVNSDWWEIQSISETSKDGENSEEVSLLSGIVPTTEGCNSFQARKQSNLFPDEIIDLVDYDDLPDRKFDETLLKSKKKPIGESCITPFEMSDDKNMNVLGTESTMPNVGKAIDLLDYDITGRGSVKQSPPSGPLRMKRGHFVSPLRNQSACGAETTEDRIELSDALGMMHENVIVCPIGSEQATTTHIKRKPEPDNLHSATLWSAEQRKQSMLDECNGGCDNTESLLPTDLHNSALKSRERSMFRGDNVEDRSHVLEQSAVLGPTMIRSDDSDCNAKRLAESPGGRRLPVLPTSNWPTPNWRTAKNEIGEECKGNTPASFDEEEDPLISRIRERSTVRVLGANGMRRERHNSHFGTGRADPPQNRNRTPRVTNSRQRAHPSYQRPSPPGK